MYQAAGGSGILPFFGRDRNINSIVLLSNGISFAIQIVIFLLLGSYADFGSWRPNILIVSSMVAFGIGFGWLGVHTKEQWQIGVGLYIVGLIAYQTTFTFWAAAFPGLARNTTDIRAKAEELKNGKISRDEYDFADSMKRNEISNTAFCVQSVGATIILAVTVGVVFSTKTDSSEANNNWGLSVLIAFPTGIWLLLSIPWFFLEKHRSGIEAGRNIVITGLLQLWRAVTQIWQLRQTLAYLIGRCPHFINTP